MCGIVDNDVAFEVFGNRQTEAGKGFRNWLDERGGPLAVGGDLLDELAQTTIFDNGTRVTCNPDSSCR